MKTFVATRKKRRCTCIHCKELYQPDCRNRHHQKYCSKPQCRQASKRASQRRWLSSSKGEGYFNGPDNAARVREWRKEHPGYWKRMSAQRDNALQDVFPSQVVDNKTDKDILSRQALQDICSLQPALIIGLIANLTGSTLQDEIAQTTRRLIVSGSDILGFSPHTTTF